MVGRNFSRMKWVVIFWFVGMRDVSFSPHRLVDYCLRLQVLISPDEWKRYKRGNDGVLGCIAHFTPTYLDVARVRQSGFHLIPILHIDLRTWWFSKLTYRFARMHGSTPYWLNRSIALLLFLFWMLICYASFITVFRSCMFKYLCAAAVFHVTAIISLLSFTRIKLKHSRLYVSEVVLLEGAPAVSCTPNQRSWFGSPQAPSSPEGWISWCQTICRGQGTGLFAALPPQVIVRYRAKPHSNCYHDVNC